MNTATAPNRNKAPLKLGKLSSIATIAVQRQGAAPDAELDLDRIYSVAQVRKKFRNLAELAASIKLNGMIEPIVVHEEPDGRHRIIVGERRFHAAPLVPLTKVPVIIKRGLTELEIRRLQIAENCVRDDLTPFEQAMGVIQDVEQYGVPEAMKIWNITSEGWISKRVAVQRYAEPVRDLLELELCGDFEVLHSLNQLHALSVDEFTHLMHRLKQGLPLSRDEARDKVAAVKAFQRERADFDKRRAAVQQSAKPAPSKPGIPPTSHAEVLPAGAAASASTETAPIKASRAAPAQPSAEEVEAARRWQAQQTLDVLRKDVFEWGETNLEHFDCIKVKMAELGIEMHEANWVLWSGFLSMVLPMLHSLGDDTAVLFLKKLQRELKSHKPVVMWRVLHPMNEDLKAGDKTARRIEIPVMPADWRL